MQTLKVCKEYGVPCATGIRNKEDVERRLEQGFQISLTCQPSPPPSWTIAEQLPAVRQPCEFNWASDVGLNLMRRKTGKRLKRPGRSYLAESSSSHCRLDKFPSGARQSPRNVCSNGSEDPFNGAISELPHRFALHTNRVVMMLAARHDVLGRSVGQRQLAQHPGVQKKLDGSIHRRSTHLRQLFADFLGSEPLILCLQQTSQRYGAGLWDDALGPQGSLAI